MAQFICPSCGSGFFLTSRTAPKTIFKVVSKRIVQIIQSPPSSFDAGETDLENICCGACSWQGRLDELIESHKD